MSERATAVQKAPVPSLKKEPTGGERPFKLFDQIYNEIASRAFAIFQGNGGDFGHESDHWFQAESQLLHPVHLNVVESDNAISVDAEVPGFEPKDLAVGLEGRRLTITGRREIKEEQKKGKAIYQERCSNEILRVVQLPADVDGEKAKTKLINGILEIEMPKTANANVKRIEVKVA